MGAMASSAADRPSASAIGWEPAVSAIDPADRVFGGFEVLRRVTRCGAAEVHLARRKDRHQVVALKRLRPVHRDDAAQRRALRAEGDFLLRVRHPGLCSVVEAGDVDDEPFLALEHLRGATLGALEAHAVRTGDPLDARLVLSVAVHVCRVVHWLHGLQEQTDGLVGGVHQALTPSHIFITTGGAVKLLDLGAALDAPHMRLERIGLAEQRYRAPEVQGGGTADPRTDVFAIGASVLEALAAGEAPFTASSDADPLRRAAGFFLDRAVAEDPERRFQNVAVLEHATVRVLAKNGGLASTAELGALASLVVEGGRTDSSPEISWPALGRGEANADAFSERTVEIPLPAELARMDESVDDVTLLAVRAAAPRGVEDPDDPLAEAPTGDLAGEAEFDDLDDRQTMGRGGLVLPAPPERPLSRGVFDRADTARPSFEPPALSTPVAPVRDPSARRWKLAFCGLAIAMVSAGVVLGGGDRITGRELGEPMVSALVRAAEPPRREPDFTSRVSEALAAPVITPPARPAFTPAAVPAATEGSLLAADPTPWQAVRRRWATCVENSDCGSACQGRFSILIDDGGVPYSVESSAGDVPQAVSSCLIGVTRRSKDLRRLLAKLGVSELTWTPTRAPVVGETAPPAAAEAKPAAPAAE
jgi:hypothetical protein